MYRWTIVWFTELNDVQYVNPPIKTPQNVCRSYIDGLRLSTKLSIRFQWLLICLNLIRSGYILEKIDSISFEGSFENFIKSICSSGSQNNNYDNGHKHYNNLPSIRVHYGFDATDKRVKNTNGTYNSGYYININTSDWNGKFGWFRTFL